MNSRFTIILIAMVAVFVGIFVTTKDKNEAPAAGSSSLSNHVEGGNAKGVTLVEYGDFQCPACTAYYPIVKEAVESHKADIQFQFVNFPLTQLHPNAMAAHRAAEAAHKQGKYWEMHDMLYEQHDSWADSKTASTIFEGYAQQLGLDVAKFRADAASSATNDIIQADIKKGQSLDITGTPTFFLNGKKVDKAPQTPEDFGKLLDQAIAAKK